MKSQWKDFYVKVAQDSKRDRNPNLQKSFIPEVED